MASSIAIDVPFAKDKSPHGTVCPITPRFSFAELGCRFLSVCLNYLNLRVNGNRDLQIYLGMICHIPRNQRLLTNTIPLAQCRHVTAVST
jgi:hypothetical protein